MRWAGIMVHESGKERQMRRYRQQNIVLGTYYICLLLEYQS
jgi:hypothetical protein